jgi:hypothetical protein
MFTVNPELLKMARTKFEKSAVVPSEAAMGMGGEGGAMPYMNRQMGAVTPEQAAMGAAPPPGGDPSQGAPPMDPSQDPTGAAAAAAPPVPAAAPAPPPAAPADPAAGQPAQQKLKPEQMMQMLDFRMYNMQQILTAIAQSLNVQIDPSVLVMPPGTTGAPPAEAALPGGAMAPQPQQDPNAPAGPQAPGGPLPPGGPMDPSQMPVDPNAGKQAWWERAAAELPVDPNKPTPMQLKAAAMGALLRSVERAG